MQLVKLSTGLFLIALFITCSVLVMQENNEPLTPFTTLSVADEDVTIETARSFYPLFLRPAAAPAAARIKAFPAFPASSAAQTSVWAEIIGDLKLDDHAESPRVQAQLKGLLANKAELQKSLRNSAPYIHYIYSQIKERGFPAELALIPIIESNYNPYDHNSIGANGLWQLMPGTARGLGVKMTQGYDGRRDLISSTKAALDYYSYLNTKFKGNWYLAIAAYNCGDGRVSSSVRKAKSSNFFDLALPLETKLYVPRLMAIAIILKNPQKYGVVLPEVENKPSFTTVEVDKSTSLKDYAKTNGIEFDRLQQLNPVYKNTNINVNISKTLLIPVENEKNEASKAPPNFI